MRLFIHLEKPLIVAFIRVATVLVSPDLDVTFEQAGIGPVGGTHWELRPFDCLANETQDLVAENMNLRMHSRLLESAKEHSHSSGVTSGFTFVKRT